MASFNLRVVVDKPPISTSISDLDGSDPVAKVLHRLDLDFRKQKYHAFKMVPGSPYPKSNDIAAFVKKVDLAQAEEMGEPNPVDKWFKLVGTSTAIDGDEKTPIDPKSVQILVLHESFFGTSHDLSLRLQSSPKPSRSSMSNQFSGMGRGSGIVEDAISLAQRGYRNLEFSSTVRAF